MTFAVKSVEVQQNSRDTRTRDLLLQAIVLAGACALLGAIGFLEYVGYLEYARRFDTAIWKQHPELRYSMCGSLKRRILGLPSTTALRLLGPPDYAGHDACTAKARGALYYPMPLPINGRALVLTIAPDRSIYNIDTWDGQSGFLSDHD